jgi:hypothetical protein
LVWNGNIENCPLLRGLYTTALCSIGMGWYREFIGIHYSTIQYWHGMVQRAGSLLFGIHYSTTVLAWNGYGAVLAWNG